MKEQQHKQNRGKLAAVAILAAAFALTGTAVRPAHAADVTISKWVDQIKVSGDFRLRQENFWYPKDTAQKAAKVDRSRERYRLRLGLDLPMPNDLTLKTRFATGTGEQVSTNQTLANLSNQKQFWLDRAFLEWKTTPWLKLQGGRMANPLWTQYSSDIVWDDDFNPEGAAESLNYLVVGQVQVFANAMQMVVNEVSGSQRDPALLANQVGAEVRLPLESRFRVAYTNYDWIHENARSMNTSTTTAFNGENAVQDGNRRLGNTPANDFLVHEITGNLGFWVVKIPVQLQGTYIVNGQARSGADLGTDKLPQLNRGYQVGGIVGKASAKNSWEAAYFYKKSQMDATYSDVADSDFGNGGTNRRGHIMWFAYNPQEYLQLKAKYFITQKDEVALAPTAGKPVDINRLQVDVSVKF